MPSSVKLSELKRVSNLTPNDLLLVTDLDGPKSPQSKVISYQNLQQTMLSELRSISDSLVALTGVSRGATDMGTFTSDTVSNNANLKVVLQQLASAISNLQDHVDALDHVEPGDNINRLKANTSADAVPASYSYIVVDKATGDIKTIDKSFLEVLPD